MMRLTELPNGFSGKSPPNRLEDDDEDEDVSFSLAHLSSSAGNNTNCKRLEIELFLQVRRFQLGILRTHKE